MGDVVSISRVSDNDIFSQFDAQCPGIPASIDTRIPRSARKAVDKSDTGKRPHNFRNHCVVVVVLSVLVLTAVKIVSNGIASHIGMARTDVSFASTEFRNSRDTWLSHIKALEQDPLYQKILHEKMLFAEAFAE